MGFPLKRVWVEGSKVKCLEPLLLVCSQISWGNHFRPSILQKKLLEAYDLKLYVIRTICGDRWWLDKCIDVSHCFAQWSVQKVRKQGSDSDMSSVAFVHVVWVKDASHFSDFISPVSTFYFHVWCLRLWANFLHRTLHRTLQIFCIGVFPKFLSLLKIFQLLGMKVGTENNWCLISDPK